MFRRSAALLTAVAALGLSACGAESITSSSEPAESEALYLDLNGLKYQVQLSRQLNPALPEDGDYFRGIDQSERFLPKGSVWFGVFIRVENEYDRPIPSAREFEIDDTRGNKFEPIDSEGVYAYQPETIPNRGYIPNQEDLQAYSGTQGSLLLFKIPLESLDNRPLELAIKDPSDTRKAVRVDLDV
ncbi:MAG: hypothetical protein H0V81_08510 [Solirubrobacterales bacterium]|nr:hypothetical protein [Solirubrobacterales bacterium]